MLPLISIHAPLAGCDRTKTILTKLTTKFQSTHPLRGATIDIDGTSYTYTISIHAPLAGCDHRHFYYHTSGLGFQSTHPLRGATRSSHFISAVSLNFNPRTPCGVRLFCEYSFKCQQAISIHAPLAGCDQYILGQLGRYYQFQSTHPLRGATEVADQDHGKHPISIHAPLAGCDHCKGTGFPVPRHFNPRTPCGVRLPSHDGLICQG